MDTATTIDKGHGRVERRTLKATTALNESSSPSDQTPSTLTLPPWTEASGLGLLAPGAPQAAAITMATRPRSNPRLGFKVRMCHPQTKCF